MILHIIFGIIIGFIIVILSVFIADRIISFKSD
jgi:hypothetical protein